MEPLSPGAFAPDFVFTQSSGSAPVRLSGLRGQPVVLAFSPPGWNPARAEEVAHTRRLLAQAGFSGELLGLSHDGLWCRAALADGMVQFPVLTDAQMDENTARLYGVAGKHALFVVDGKGVVRWRHIAAPGVAPRVEDLLAGLQSLQFAVPTPATANGVTRREFMAAAMGIALALSLMTPPARAAELPPPAAPPPPILIPPTLTGTVPVTLSVNGTTYPLHLEPRVTLLDALRDRLHLTGSKKGCDHGQCGACTVHVNGRRINSCLALAVAQQGKEITTIEGLAQGETLHPMQAAFIQHDGFQCGFCTPGQIMSAVALLKEPVGPEDNDVRENMSGNLCRCGAYPNIVAAVQDVRKGAGNASV